jgi:hypothetical protein
MSAPELFSGMAGIPRTALSTMYNGFYIKKVSPVDLKPILNIVPF